MRTIVYHLCDYLLPPRDPPLLEELPMLRDLLLLEELPMLRDLLLLGMLRERLLEGVCLMLRPRPDWIDELECFLIDRPEELRVRPGADLKEPVCFLKVPLVDPPESERVGDRLLRLPNVFLICVLDFCTATGPRLLPNVPL
jgi:hypothetical protein